MRRIQAYLTHPTVGRFLVRDPGGYQASGLNLYAYCGNNPVNWVDASGLKGRYDPYDATTWGDKQASSVGAYDRMIRSPSAADPAVVKAGAEGETKAGGQLLLFVVLDGVGSAVMKAIDDAGEAYRAWRAARAIETDVSAALEAARAGDCFGTACSVANIYRSEGKAAEFVVIKTQGESGLIGFGDKQIATNGYHVAVKVGDKIIDSFTGPQGMTVKDYLSNISVVGKAPLVKGFQSAADVGTFLGTGVP